MEKENSQVNNLNLHLENEKKNKPKPKVSRKKEVTKNRMEVNEIENRKIK